RRYRAAVLQAAVEGRIVLTEAQLAARTGRPFEPVERVLTDLGIEAAKATTGEQGSLPAGWAWGRVSDLSHEIRYGTSAKTSEEPSGVPVLRMGNIRDGNIDPSKLKYLPTKHSEFPTLLLSNGDVLFNRTNSSELVGKTAVYHGYPSTASFASYLIRVRLGAACRPDYLACYLNSVHGRSWIRSVVIQQVGQANVNGSKLGALTIPLPPSAEQARIIAEVSRRLSLISELEQAVSANLRRAARLRQSILKRAFECKLVPQDPSDEPASVLVTRIQAERAASQIGRRTKAAPSSSEDGDSRVGRRIDRAKPAPRLACSRLPAMNCHMPY
ncbi:MAG: restriction endonuclease subunit S, partial [Chloroflexota bacterium]